MTKATSSQPSLSDEKPDVHTLPLVKDAPKHGPDAPHHITGTDWGHGHEHRGDHVPHVLPLQNYIATWVTLMVLTILTVAASYANFGTWNLVIALLIATTKACVVAAIFMHLRYDRKFHTVIFSFSVIFLGIFIAFTMFDTETRGRADSVEADRPVTVTTPFAGGKAERDLKERYSGKPLEGGSAAEQVKKIPTPASEAPPPSHK